MKVIDVRATVVFLDGVFYLKCAGVEKPLTMPEFADIARKATVEELSPPKRKRAAKKAKKKASAPAAEVVPIDAVDPRVARSQKGLCSFCSHKPIKGKKLCAKHLKTARRSAAAARKTRTRNRRAAA